MADAPTLQSAIADCRAGSPARLGNAIARCKDARPLLPGRGEPYAHALRSCRIGFACRVLAGSRRPRRQARRTWRLPDDSIVACGNCHVRRDKDGRPLPALGLSGGMLFDEEPFRAYARNITPDPETGIGKWSDAQIIRAFREGIRPDGTVIGPPMPIAFYRGVSDADAQALVAYLRAQPPVKNVVPRSEYRIKLPPAYGPPIQEKIVAPPRGDLVRYGAYLAGPLGTASIATRRGGRDPRHAAGRSRRQPIQRAMGPHGLAQPHAARIRAQGLERCRDRSRRPHRQEP